MSNRHPLRILSLGAGVQSTTLLLMALAGEIERPDHVIFSDTGWEPKQVYEHLARLEIVMRDAKIPFHKVRAGNLRRDALDPTRRSASMPLFLKDSAGKQGMIRRQCTQHYKIQPLLLKQRELVGLKKGQRSKEHLATTIIGISWDEAQRMRDAAFPWLRNEYPLIDLRMTRQDCLDWCAAHGFAPPPRSACIGCPFKSDAEWRRLRDSSPEEWGDAVDFDDALRQSQRESGRIRHEVFLHRSLVPLRDADLRTDAERGILSLFSDDFGQECEGMCGL